MDADKVILREFLSTPSARRATYRKAGALPTGGNFYPRPLRGGRPISKSPFTFVDDFYPRPLRGGRLPTAAVMASVWAISIHALCEEGDRAGLNSTSTGQRISIHALCEEGDSKNRDKISIFKQIIQHSARI